MCIMIINFPNAQLPRVEEKPTTPDDLMVRIDVLVPMPTARRMIAAMQGPPAEDKRDDGDGEAWRYVFERG